MTQNVHNLLLCFLSKIYQILFYRNIQNMNINDITNVKSNVIMIRLFNYFLMNFVRHFSIWSSWAWCDSRQKTLIMTSKRTGLPDSSSANSSCNRTFQINRRTGEQENRRTGLPDSSSANSSCNRTFQINRRTGEQGYRTVPVPTAAATEHFK